MRKCYLIISLIGLLLPGIAFPQTPGTSCGQKQVTDRLFINNPHLKVFQQQIERQMQAHALKVKQGLEQPYQPNAVVTLPVVVHIIHNNGTENLTDARVLTAIQHLNEAFANTGYYDPTDGVNTEIQFCLAQRDPNNNPTNGIDRVVSPLTVMDGWNNGAQDLAVKNLSRWDPRCYINIWIVKEIIGAVAGYAYLPSAHGMNIDGIVGEAAYFGSSNANDVLIIHEMGHYLGLYHTFQGGCTNNDCTRDGDQVCDTPPDQSTAGISCNSTANSCSTDALSGFSTDVNDLHTDYLDYGNWNCMKVFTQGQATRMNWMIQNVRKSLLSCKSCMSPCPTPVIANFSSSGNNVSVGTTVNFTNSSANASAYEWYINNILQTTTTNYSYTFNTVGTYIIKLWALTNNVLCDSAVKFDTVRVTCPVTAAFTPLGGTYTVGQTVNFINASTSATAYQWKVNNSPQSAALNYSHTFVTPGIYIVTLIATNNLCTDSITTTIGVNDTIPSTIPDSCIKTTYQRIFNNPYIYQTDMVELNGGDYITIGNFKSNPADPASSTGNLNKFSSDGNLIWCKKYEYRSSFFFTDLIPDGNNGGIILGGSRQDQQNNNFIHLLRVDVDGNVLNNRTYSFIEPRLFAQSVYRSAEGDIYIYVHLNRSGFSSRDAIMLIKLDPSFNIIWSQQFDPVTNALFQLYDITEAGSNIILSTLEFYGPGKSLLIAVDKTSGNIVNTKHFIINNTQTRFEFLKKSNQSTDFFVSGSISNSLSIPFIFRFDSNLAIRQSFLSDSTLFLAAPRLAIDANDDVLLGGNYRANTLSFNTQPCLVKLNSSFDLKWKKRYTFPTALGIAYHQIQFTRSNQILAGSLIFLPSNLGGEPYALFSKYSLNGELSECNSEDMYFAKKNYSLVTGDFFFNTINSQLQPVYGQFTPLPHINPLIATECSGTIDVCLDTIPPVDTCGNITFQKKIGGTGIDLAFDIKVHSNNQYLIAGSTTSAPGSGNNEEALFIKLNNKGNILWQRAIGGARKDQYTKIVINTAGEYLVFGKTESQHNTNGSMLLTKFDINGVILWTKEYNFTNASLTGFDNVAGAIELPNGDIAFCANAPGMNTDVGQPLPATFNIIGVLSNTGTLKWVKRFREYYTESGGPVTGIIAMNDALFVSASYGIMKMTVSDGTLLGLQKKFQNLGSFNSIEPYGSQIMIYSQSHQLVFDQNLNLVSAYMMLPEHPSYLLTANGFSSENGGAMQGDYFKSSVDYNVFLSRFNSAGNYRWSYRYPYPISEYRGLSGSRNTIDNGLVAIGTRYKKTSDVVNEPADIFILRTDSLGRIPDCPRASLDPSLQTVQGIYIELHARTYPIATQVFDLSLQAQNPQLTVQSLCSTMDCSTLSLSAKDTVCSFSDTVQIRAYKDSACDAFTEWIVDTTVARIISQNDSILTIQFRRAGVFTIYARLTGGCRLLQDSVTLTVFNSPDSINLGPDIQLCKISTYTFNAGTGFKSYQWQDGSTDSTLTIYYPGVYHVVAEDYCGNLYRDTVVVSQSPDIPFDLGPDLKICNNDTITITAPNGFTKYYWSPGYRIDSLYARTIKVSPAQDTTYIVIAERSPGCLVTDSIRVTVNRARPLQLGNDTSFCEKDSISISANPGFNSYLWNTGAAAQNIWVHSPGNYSVVATDSNGCKSRDTMAIVSLLALPAINLGPDIPVCKDAVHSFDAGNFSSYLWQDGSTNRVFNASSPGQYWVRVNNANGCVNSDTVSIVGYTESPQNFLDSSAEICLGQTLEIKAAPGYKQYRWFNNASSPSITITVPGVYWLEVTNTEGCVTRDSISVKAKDCVKGIFFPNAFTPGNGGKNNVFRPIVSGQIESFHMIVFNRYGQKVFETKDAYKGWDGRINSQLQGTNTFTWTAIYRFMGANEIQQNAKGTVTLIR